MTALFLGVLGYVSLWGQDLDFAPDRPDGPAKIQSALWELATPGAAKPIRDLQDTVVVILVPHLGQASASIDTSSLAALGGRVLAQSKSLMRVSVPASSLLAVSELPGVRFVRRPHRPYAQQETWSEGGRLIKAYDNYFEGVRGQGVKVAIIDDAFKGADQLALDMPERWWYFDYTGEGIYAGESAHGTACTEIVHDVAPEAELTLLKVGDLVDLENAKDICIQEGIDIINHSMGWFGTGIGDGRGRACDIVNDATDKGILWVNSAGNDAQSHYYGFWSDDDSDHDSNNWHNFSPEDEVLSFEAEKGDEIRIFLTWNDWPDSRQNYDLYLFIDSSDGLERVVESTDRQNVFGGVPVERVEYKVERSGRYGIAVRSEDARPRRLKIWSLNHDFEEYSVAENSIGSPADARGAMSVGAIHFDYYDLGRIADYSSRGPTTDDRVKPELVAPSGVSTVSYGASEEFYGYTGTSAAAPHVAGAAALIKSANPSYSRDQLWDALVDATVDIGTRGRDNDSGYGKLVLPVMQVSSSPKITSISPNRVRYNQVVTIRGTAFGANQGTSRVIFHGGKEPSPSQYVSWSDTQIQVRVPTGARTGNLQVVTTRGNDSARLTITSPWISRISPQNARPNTVVTVNGENFGSSRGSSSVRIGSVVVSSFASWSSSAIRLRIPLNTPPGNLTVRTSEGTSNSVRLEITSPYLTSIWPTQVKTGDRLTLTGGNFGTTRGTGYVLFASNVRPSAVDYVSWSDRRIVVEVPDGAQSGNVRVSTSNGTSGSKRLEIGEQLEPLPSRGLFGYSPPTVTKNPKSVKFGFEGIGEDIAMTWSLKNDAVVDILVNDQQRWNVSANDDDDWRTLWVIISQTYLNSGQNVLEFRNRANQNRTSSFTHWQLKDVRLWKPFNAKLIAGAEFLGYSRSVVESGLGDPFPTPFNAEVTIPFTLVEAGPVQLAVYNLLGQQIRVLADGWLDVGAHRVRWDGRTAAGVESASGVYWAVLQAGGAVQTAKLALIR